MIGGLHDYAFQLTKEKLISIIMNFTSQYPELSFEGELEIKKTLFAIKIGGGVHDFIWRYSKQELATMAIACNYYPNKFQYLPIIGGPDKYIGMLSQEELTKIVVKCTEDHPELQNAQKLEELKNNYLNDVEMGALRYRAMELENENNQNKRPVLGGLHDYINKMTKEELVAYIKEHSQKLGVYSAVQVNDELSALQTYALAVEREMNGSRPVLGGLHDYIRNMSVQDLCEYINNNKSAHGFKVTGVQEDVELSALRTVALSLENSKTQEPVLGGIHDYIRFMTKEQLVDYINKN